jgi:hypothetical protein
MKTQRNVIGAIVVVALSYAAGRAGIPDRDGSVAWGQSGGHEPPKEVTPGIRELADVTAPGRNHRVLDDLIGTWAVEYTMRAGPDGEPMVARGTVERSWVLDGRFVREVVKAQGAAGSFEGLGYIGFDNFDGQYKMIWMDDKSTSIQIETGTYHPDEKVMHVRSGYRDPVTGRMVNTWSKLNSFDPDRHLLTGYATDPNGRTFKAMEGVLVREDSTGG